MRNPWSQTRVKALCTPKVAAHIEEQRELINKLYQQRDAAERDVRNLAADNRRLKMEIKQLKGKKS